MPARIPFAVPYRPTLLALCCSLSLSAHASQETGTLELGATTVSADAPAPGALPPVYAGGQVARGAQLGVLGNQDIMDVPFSMAPIPRN